MSMASRTRSTTALKGFLDLPRNVRDKVYCLLFTGDKTFYPNHSWGKLVEGIALLRCCETTRDEGCTVLYGSNKLVLDPETLVLIWRFLDVIGDSNRGLLRHVSIDLFDCPDDAESIIEGGRDCTSATSFDITG